MKRYSSLLFLTALTFVLAACGDKTPPLKPRAVGYDSIDVTMLEQSTGNISYWLRSGVKGATLVNISPVDGLVPVTPDNLDSLVNLAKRKDFAGLDAKGDTTKEGFLFSPDNLVYVAAKLGIADEVYWVMPKFGELVQEDVDQIKKVFIEKFPEQAAAISTMKLEDKATHVNLNGVSLHIMSLLDLPPLKEKHAVVHMDNSFFSSLYKNEKDTKALSMVAGFYTTLKEAGVNAELVSLSYSNENGLSPLKFRYLGGYVRRLFKEPTLISQVDPPKLWKDRSEAWRLEQVSFKDAIPVYKSIVKEFPDDAGSHYDLSYALFQAGDYEGSKGALKKAAEIDPEYNIGYQDFAVYLEQIGKHDIAKTYIP